MAELYNKMQNALDSLAGEELKQITTIIQKRRYKMIRAHDSREVIYCMHLCTIERNLYI